METENNNDNIIDLSNLDESTDTENITDENTTGENFNQNIEVLSFQKNRIFYNVYRTLESLIQGTEYNEANWILLLTKTMTLVNEIKGLSRDERIKLTAELVFYYLEENTMLQPMVFQEIKLSVFSLIETFLSVKGTNKKQHIKKSKSQVKNLMKKDTDIVVSPLQITNTLVKRIVNTIKGKDINTNTLRQEFPSLILLSISLLDKYSHLTGNEKKNLIIQALSDVINIYIIEGELISFNEEEKIGLNLLLSELSVLIDTLVGIANGKKYFKFNFDNPESILQCITKVFTLISPFISRCKQ